MCVSRGQTAAYRLDVHQLPAVDDLLSLHDAHPVRYPFLAESAAHGTPQGRYDILFAFPGRWLRLEPAASKSGDQGDFLAALDDWWRSERATPCEDGADLPFLGGWFLYLGYELARQVEPVLRLPEAPAMPVAFACRIPAAVIRDRVTGRTTLVAEREAGIDAAVVAADVRETEPGGQPGGLLCGTLSEDEPERFISVVEAAKHFIREGDIFQANLSRAWRGRLAAGVRGSALYRRLRASNPGPFCGLAEWDDWSIVSSSPERLLRVHSGRAETRPIAGTRPRGAHPVGDRELTRELISHPKERAEHVMLVDLERNDLGRVCEPGSVTVDEMMVIESYAHVHHIVSNVRGRLRPSVTPGEAIRAVFPGGTITGCPKVRCMEIIAELEAEPRGPYTGSMGYLNRDGSMDLNILIRTLHRQGRQIRFNAGAGIVADSDARRELDETRAKALGLVRALNAEAP